MSHRVGICSSCEANYKVPADFAADKAKCKECGGVVEIGAVVEDPPPPPVPAKPVRKAEPKLEEHIPSGKKGDGPSMMEKLRSQKQAARRAQSAKVVPAAPAAETAAPKTSATPRKKASAGDGPPKAKAGSRRAAPSRSARPSRRRRGADDEGDDEEETPGRRTRAKKQKSPVALICTLVLLVSVGGAGIYVMMGSEDAEAGAEDTAKHDVEETAVDLTQESEAASEEAAVEPEDEAPVEEPVKEEKPKPTSNSKVKDPMEIDLASLPDFGPAPGCSADDWAIIQEDATLLVDPQAGAAGARAGRNLEKTGRNAIPALINVFKTRDMGTDAGFRDGDVLQRTLEKIYNGKNFGWKYTTEPNDHWYNRKVIENHWKLWDKYQGDEAGWLRFTGLDKEGQTPSGGEDELSVDELDELDALDDI